MQRRSVVVVTDVTWETSQRLRHPPKYSLRCATVTLPAWQVTYTSISIRTETTYYEPADDNRSPSRHPRARHCDVLIRCCYILENNMTLRPETPQTGTAKPLQPFSKRCRDVSRRFGTTLAAVLLQYSVFKMLEPIT
ncbi:hypothetical protein MRX96_034637 [Rhipicephalus microplus]